MGFFGTLPFYFGALLSDLLNIPHFVTAKSKKELMRSMLQNNIDRGMRFRYFDISFDGKEWSAWYNIDARATK